MKHFINRALLVICIMFLIVISYGWIQHRFPQISFTELSEYFSDFSIRDHIKSEENIDLSSEKKEVNSNLNRSVWLSYIEFQSYEKSTENNSEKSFRKFYDHILRKCDSLHITNIIVQVRPFSDALYPSKYFPWSEYISGIQGRSIPYDPLKIMVEMTHKYDMTLEAWINPYRVCSDSNIDSLSDDNMAKIWMNNPDKKNNVLHYNGNYYYNPAVKEVRSFIVDGVKEIIQNYGVDGIHMDDYFYPKFTRDNVKTDFDAYAYKSEYYKGKINEGTSIADWRRENVNQLIRTIYKTIKKQDPDILFGISPQGNLNNLRSDLMDYVDIDSWIKDGDYVDYIMPQIYWGFTSKEAPFDQMTDQWIDLCKDSSVTLKIGIPLYRLGDGDKTKSDYKEFRSSKCIEEELNYLEKSEKVSGVCFFSFQYLDADNKAYHFATTEYEPDQKNILAALADLLEK